MRAIINGKKYNTRSAEELTMIPGDSEECLYQTKTGDFFLHKSVTYLDGREMGCDEVMPPELQPMEAAAARKRRVSCKQTIIPMSAREALTWSIKTQTPETFRGYLLGRI